MICAFVLLQHLNLIILSRRYVISSTSPSRVDLLVLLYPETSLDRIRYLYVDPFIYHRSVLVKVMRYCARHLKLKLSANWRCVAFLHKLTLNLLSVMICLSLMLSVPTRIDMTWLCRSSFALHYRFSYLIRSTLSL
jgi:hypothetical protein